MPVALLDGLLVAQERRGWQDPLGHLSIRRIGQIDFPDRQGLIHGAGEGGGFEPVTVGVQHVAEPSQPSVCKDVIVCVWPGSELLAIVGADDHRARPFVSDLAEIFERFVRFVPGHEVPHFLGVREDLEQPAVVFGQVVAEEFGLAETSALEVEVVEHGVLDSGLGQGRDEVLFPNPFGHPHAANRFPEHFLEICGIVTDLSHAVSVGDHRKDRLL